MKNKIFLGVGHGGADPGAVGNGLKEKDLTLAIARACESELKRHGVQVKLSRYRDENDNLSQEVSECNAYGPDLAVDIHINAGGGDGAEAFYHHRGGTSKALADNILAEVKRLGQNSRGAKSHQRADGKDYYGFIRQTTAPAVIVECAFIDNAKDIQIIDTAAEQKQMGVAIAKGILTTLGIAYKPQSIDGLYRVQVGAFSKKANAERKRQALEAAGFKAYLACVDGKLWRVQVGAFALKENADRMLAKVNAAGFTGYTTQVGGAKE